MPELPDLAYIESVLQPALAGRRIIAARTGDPLVLRVMVPDPFPSVLVGRRITSVTRRGHFMHFALAADHDAGGGALSIVINAMLVGRYRLLPLQENQKTPARDPVALGLALQLEGQLELQYLDQKRMGKVYIARAADEAQIPVFGQLGVDLISDDFTRETFGRLIAKRRDQVRMFLMDKRALASIGNAYADEILFAAQIHPKTFCNKLRPPRSTRSTRPFPRAETRDRRDRAPARADRDQGARLPGGARSRRQTLPGLRHHHPRRPGRRRRRLLLPHLPTRRPQAVRRLEQAPWLAKTAGTGFGLDHALLAQVVDVVGGVAPLFQLAPLDRVLTQLAQIADPPRRGDAEALHDRVAQPGGSGGTRASSSRMARIRSLSAWMLATASCRRPGRRDVTSARDRSSRSSRCSPIS